MTGVQTCALPISETDLSLLKISLDFVNDAKRTLPKLKEDVEKELKKKGLREDMIKMIFKRDLLEEFKELSSLYDDLNFVAKVLMVYPKDIQKHLKISEDRIEKFLNKDSLAFVLEKLNEKKISESQVKQVLERIVKGTRPQDAILFKKQDVGEIEEAIMKMIKEKPGLNANAYMGLVMKEFKGKIDGGEAMKIIKKFMK